MLANPAKFAPSRSLPPLSFNAFHWDGEVMASLGLDPVKLPLALVTSRDSDKVCVCVCHSVTIHGFTKP